MAHTPGPWTAYTYAIGWDRDICVDSAGHGIIADVGGGDLATRLANASLIAAAPSMLDALKQCVAVWGKRDLFLLADEQAALKNARLVIAEATTLSPS